ncbi:phage major tail protein, TP901-1 family [Aerococcus urinaeequi]
MQQPKLPLGSAAILPAYRTDGSTTLGGEFTDEQTQQGRILEKSTDEHTIEVTQYFAPADESVETVENAQKTGKSVKVWEVTVDDSVAKGSGSEKDYPAKFGYAKVSEIERGAGVEDLVELSYELSVVGALQDGRFPLTDDEVNILNEVYAYQNPGETTGDYDAITRGNESGE